MRWAGRLAAPGTTSLPRMMPVENLSANVRDDLAAARPLYCRALQEATLSEALGQTNHW